MLKTSYASTFEVDEPSEAVQDILDQIDFDALLENSVGILGCSLDYVTNSTIELLCEKLPFDVIGATTYCSAVSDDFGEDLLSLLILTSDDVYFACSSTSSHGNDTDSYAKEAFEMAAAQLPGEPVFGIVMFPYIESLSSDKQIASLDRASNKLPLFGSVAVDFTDVVRTPQTIYNGQSFPESCVLLLVSGNISPRFFFTAMPEGCFFKQNAIITSSEGNILKEINEMRAADYLAFLGLAKDGVFQPAPSIMLSIYTGDGGSSLARAIFDITPEGYVVCGGDMPENAVLGVGSIGKDDVFSSAEDLAHKILEEGAPNGALLFSCLSRSITLGSQPMGEIEVFQSVFKEKVPYLLMYSGGEMFPEITEEATFNKAHNASIIVCVF
ncbi:MAG: FIST C-terminal domain-containing protein [Eggerthellaceae bacterium]|nr:FIST C-terminal domain-containing protein [Eggerthellaceae bacterium]